jgi:hypothetical protein
VVAALHLAEVIPGLAHHQPAQVLVALVELLGGVLRGDDVVHELVVEHARAGGAIDLERPRALARAVAFRGAHAAQADRGHRPQRAAEAIGVCRQQPVRHEAAHARAHGEHVRDVEPARELIDQLAHVLLGPHLAGVVVVAEPVVGVTR